MNRMNSLKFVVSLGVVMMLSSLAYGRADISLDPASDSVDAFGGTPSFNVGIDAPDLYWIPAESESWITISSVDNAAYTAGYGYQGSGTVHLIAFENSSASNRVGTVTVKDAVFTLTQEVAVCTSTVTPTNIECRKSIAQDVMIQVGTSNESCEWRFIPVSDWISLKSVQTVFTGTVNNLLIHLESNEGCAARSGSCIIAGKTVTITQPAVPFTIAPLSYAAPCGASTVDVVVSSGSNCEWYVKTLSWVAMKSTNYGYSYGYNYGFTGPQTVQLSVFQNDSRSVRNGGVTFKDQTFNVTQPACTYEVSETSFDLTNAASQSVSLNVTASSSLCTWSFSSSSAWITTVSGQTSFTGSVTNLVLQIGGNEDCGERTGTCTIAGKTVTITQSAVPFTMNPSSYAAPSEASTVDVTITAGSNCEWYVKTLSWLAMKSTNYGYSYGYNYAFTGPQTVQLSVFANDSRSQRSGSVLFKDQTFDVDQTACEFKFSPKSVTKSKNGGSFTVSVDYGSACTWYVQQMVSWITFSEATRGHSLGYGYQNGYGYGYKFKGDQSLVMNVFKNDTSVKREGSICFYDRFFDGLIDSVDVTQSAAGAYVPYLILMDE